MGMKVTILVDQDGEKEKIACDNCYVALNAGKKSRIIWNAAPYNLTEWLAQDPVFMKHWHTICAILSQVDREKTIEEEEQ